MGSIAVLAVLAVSHTCGGQWRSLSEGTHNSLYPGLCWRLSCVYGRFRGNDVVAIDFWSGSQGAHFFLDEYEGGFPVRDQRTLFNDTVFVRVAVTAKVTFSCIARPAPPSQYHEYKEKFPWYVAMLFILFAACALFAVLQCCVCAVQWGQREREIAAPAFVNPDPVVYGRNSALPEAPLERIEIGSRMGRYNTVVADTELSIDFDSIPLQFSVAADDIDAGETDVVSRMQCPISLQPMRDPVCCACTNAHTFERVFLERHLRRSQTCPLSRQPLSHADITEDADLRNEILMYVAKEKARREHRQCVSSGIIAAVAVVAAVVGEKEKEKGEREVGGDEEEEMSEKGLVSLLDV